MGQAAALFHYRVDCPGGRRNWSARSPAELALIGRALDSHPDPTAISAVTTNGYSLRIVYSNLAFAELAGAICPSPANAEPTEPTNPNPIVESLREAHRHQTPYTTEVVFGGPNGSRRVFQLQSRSAGTDSESATHRITFFREVTAEKNLEEALRCNERLACIGLLGAGIAHEINNPAGSALVAAETALALKDTPGAGEQLGACLRNVVTSMDRCGRIVRTLLRYTRQEPTEQQACSLNDVVEQAVELARPYAESRGAKLHVELDPLVPLASMNPLEIELVLINLIRNAVEAGRDKPSVNIYTAKDETHVRAVVSDNGCGMDDEQLAHAFDPLYTTRRQVGGCGLGMSIARGIVEAHAGQIEVQSRPGAGATIFVKLPLTR